MMRLLIAALMAISSCLASGGSAVAGGYPPFGAWAYGSGTPVYSHARFHRISPVQPVGWYGPTWGSYGNLGFAATTRVRTSVWYRPVRSYHFGHPYHFGRPYHFGSSFYYGPAYRYHWHRPLVIHSRPIVHPGFYYSYSLPVLYYQVYRPITYYQPPTYYQPSCVANPDGAAWTFSVNAAPRIDPSISSLDDPWTRQVASSSGAGRMVTLVSDNSPHLEDLTHGSGVPDQLLDAADAILRAGGYREAATAYAQLSLRYGTTPHLLTRRFVAHVLGRDLNQAEVLVQLANVDNLHLDAAYLHVGGLQAFLESPVLIEASSEALAARALSRDKDPTALRSIAQWLELARNHEKAAMFRLAAQQLENRELESRQLESPPASEEVLGAELASMD